jgi:hypothetical protein
MQVAANNKSAKKERENNFAEEEPVKPPPMNLNELRNHQAAAAGLLRPIILAAMDLQGQTARTRNPFLAVAKLTDDKAVEHIVDQFE